MFYAGTPKSSSRKQSERCPSNDVGDNETFKEKTFTWRLLLDRLSTRVHLIKRSIILNSKANLCIFCAADDEDIYHVMFQCSFFVSVWQQVHSWIDMVSMVGLDQIDHFLKTYNSLKRKMGEK